MVRPLVIAAAAAVAFAFATPAWACSADCDCKGKHEASADAKSKDPVKAKKAAAKDEAKKQAPAPEAKEPAKEGALHLEIDNAIAGKCSCASAADCTCKKNQCECGKCDSGFKRSTLIDLLKGEAHPLQLPKDARKDASAGIFI